MALTKENANEKNLSEIPYGKLKETFEALGIPSIWKPGTKSKTMVKNALNKLAIIKSLEEKGVEQGDLESAVEIAEVEQTKDVEATEKKQKAKLKKEDDKVTAKIKSENQFTKEQLEIKIKNTQRFAKDCITTHRGFFNKKLDVLTDMLANGEYLK